MVPFPGSQNRAGTRAVVSRRALIGVALTAVAVTGCTVNDPVATHQNPTGPAQLSPDVDVATRALVEIKAARAAVASTVARFPGLRPSFTRLTQMHQAHAVSLADAVPRGAGSSGTPPAAYAVPRTRAAALRNLAAREQQLHDTLDVLALKAESGDFARLLASMGAAVQQRLGAWPT